MKIVSEGWFVEHTLSQGVSADSLLVVGTGEAIPGFSFAKAKEENLREVVRFYSENETFRNRVFIHVSHHNYEAACDIAKTEAVGVVIKIQNKFLAFHSCLGVKQLEIDEKAALDGYEVDSFRYAKELAVRVPSLMSRKEAETRISNAFLDKQSLVLRCFDAALDKVYRDFDKSRSLDLLGLETICLGKDLSLSDVATRLRAEASQAYLKGGVYILGLDMGRGKTSAGIRQVIDEALESGERVSFITHRHSIMNGNTFDGLLSQCTDSEINGIEDKLFGLSIIANRCNQVRFQAHLSTTSVLVIDEVSQVFRHVADKSFEGDQVEVWKKLIQLIKAARVVVLADACVNDDLLTALKQVGRPITYISEELSSKEKSAEIGRVDQVKDAIALASKENVPFLIGTDSRKEAEIQADLARKSGKRVLLVTGQTVTSEEVVKFFNDPNQEMRSYDVLIYTSAMQSSISIKEQYFRYHFFIFYRVIGVDEARQMTARDRTAVNIVVGIDRSRSFRTVVLGDWRRRINSGTHSFDCFAAKTEQKLAMEFNKFAQWLCICLERKGTIVSQVIKDSSALVSHKVMAKDAAYARLELEVDKLMLQVSEQITCPQLRLARITDCRLKDFLNLTKLDPAMVGRNDIIFLLSADWKSMIPNAASYLLNDEQFAVYADQAVRAEWGSKHSVYDRRRSVLTMMRVLGVSAGTGKISEVAISEAARTMRSNRYEFFGLGLVDRTLNIDTPRANHSLVTNFLRSLGLSKFRTTGKDYCLNETKLSQMKRYCAAWMQENDTCHLRVGAA